MLFIQQWSSAWWTWIQAMGVECIHFFFEITVPTDPGVSVAFYKWSFTAGKLFWLFFSLLCLKCCGNHLVVAGFWSDYGPNSAHWNLQYFKTSSVTSAISIFCNNKVAAEHHEILVWHLGNVTFYKPSGGTEQAHINLHWVAGLRSNYWWISVAVMTFFTCLTSAPFCYYK